MALLQVKTENGIVEGLPAGNQAVSVFKGIPFAKAPVGELRWKAPQPAENWDGILKAYKFAPIAMQPRFVSEGGGTSLAAQEFYVVEFPMSEDCLYLNVWTPAKTADAKLPVAVYVHGGGYETGYSYLNAYDGEGFAKRDVIMVTVSYRLNIFGFLAHPDLAAEDEHDSSGNYGIMDLIAAVEWVKRNIAAFGGDPDNLTIFGQSAGGGCVQNLLASPLTKGKVQRAIMQSSGGVSRDTIMDSLTRDKAEAVGQEFFKYVGVNSIEDARAMDADTLMDYYKKFKGAEGYGLIFTPCVDGYVIPEYQADYFQTGKHDDIDIMVGCTADEMRKAGAPAPAYETRVAMAKKNYGDKAEQFLEYIHGDDDEACQPCYENIMGDGMLAANLAWCENQNDLGMKPAFMYYFTYVPPGAAEMGGAHHSVEHHFVFETLVRSKRPYTGFDYELAGELAGYWTNFIKTGNPNPEGTDLWKPYTKEKPEALIIAEERHMGVVPRISNVEFQVKYNLGKL